MTLYTIKDSDLEKAKGLAVSVISNIKNRQSWKARQDANELNNILMNCKELKE